MAIVNVTKALAVTAVTLTAITLTVASSESREAEAAAERAVGAYLAGRYADALPDLEKARDAGVARGSHLYMLAYCYDSVRRDSNAAQQMYAAAQKKLEQETTEKKPLLESFFYLSNHLQNQRDLEGSKRVASQAIDSIDTKKLKVGTDGTSQFRVGKLHTNAGQQDRALEYYRRALGAFAKEKEPPTAYLERSLDPVVRADTGKADPKVVFEMWEKLLALNPQTQGGNWSLAVSALHAGRYAVARDAFKKARAEHNERSQEAFYAERLSDGAQSLTTAGFTIPSADVDGKAISSLSDEELESRLKERGKKAGEILARDLAQDEYQILPPVKEKARPRLVPGAKLLSEFGEAQRPLVALTIELFKRGRSLQEAAFTGGYAPLIIQNWLDLWRNNHRNLIDAAAKAK